MAQQPDYVSKGTDVTNLDEGEDILKYFQTITTAEPQTDARGEQYLDLKDCGAIDDQNMLNPILSRTALLTDYPQLEGRQVIFEFAKPLLDIALAAFKSGRTNVVLITGTPGVGKSSLRNVHAHFLLSDAYKKNKRCCLLFAKSGNPQLIRLHLGADHSYHIELVSQSSPWVTLGFNGFKRGHNLFILADISNGAIDNLNGPGLILYSSPNQGLCDEQIMKQRSLRLGYPHLTKKQVCRYSNERMDLLFERYGGLPRLLWGTEDDEHAHLSRLNDKLRHVDGFLDLLDQKDYLKGPHRYFYTELQRDQNGHYQFNLDRFPPTVVAAPRYVIKKVAATIVTQLLQHSLEAGFGRLHKAVDGILFEEVCLNLIEHHPDDIEFIVKNINNRKRPLKGHLAKGGRLKLGNFTPRRDVDSESFVQALDGTKTPYLVVPKVSNFPGLDAVLALGQIREKSGIRTPEVALELQMTRSLIHHVSDEGVTVLNEIGERMKSTKSEKHCLLFLVPEYNYDVFKPQPAKSEEKQKELDKFTQFVGCIRVVSCSGKKK